MINPTCLTKNNENIRRATEDKLMNPFLCLKMGKSMIVSLEKIDDSAKYFRFPLLIYHGDGDKITSYKDSEKFISKLPNKNRG
jgi:hypothetical protein